MISDTDCVEHSTVATTAGAEKTTAYPDNDHTAPPAAQNIVMSSKDNDSLFSGGGIR
jgi:protein phosphatase 1L